MTFPRLCKSSDEYVNEDLAKDGKLNKRPLGTAAWFTRKVERHLCLIDQKITEGFTSSEALNNSIATIDNVQSVKRQVDDTGNDRFVFFTPATGQ